MHVCLHVFVYDFIFGFNEFLLYTAWRDSNHNSCEFVTGVTSGRTAVLLLL